jgi:hypothetical protein
MAMVDQMYGLIRRKTLIMFATLKHGYQNGKPNIQLKTAVLMKLALGDLGVRARANGLSHAPYTVHGVCTGN